eukprot:5860883-Pyramimonas_sp.AAC.1
MAYIDSYSRCGAIPLQTGVDLISSPSPHLDTRPNLRRSARTWPTGDVLHTAAIAERQCAMREAE